MYTHCYSLALSPKAESYSVFFCISCLVSLSRVVTSMSLLGSWQAATTFPLHSLLMSSTNSLLLQRFSAAVSLPATMIISRWRRCGTWTSQAGAGTLAFP